MQPEKIILPLGESFKGYFCAYVGKQGSCNIVFTMIEIERYGNAAGEEPTFHLGKLRRKEYEEIICVTVVCSDAGDIYAEYGVC